MSSAERPVVTYEIRSLSGRARVGEATLERANAAFAEVCARVGPTGRVDLVEITPTADGWIDTILKTQGPRR